LQFDAPVKGNFSVEIINLAGQTIHTRNIVLQEANTLSFTLTNVPPSGVYYLRAKEINGDRTYSGKLVIQNN
jgi:hypothetical protein